MEEGLIYKSTVSQNLTFADYYLISLAKGFGCALYRLPQSNDVHMIIDFAGGHSMEKADIEHLQSGFIFHPFSAQKHNIKYLNKDIHIAQRKNDKQPKILHSAIQEEEFNQIFKQANSDVRIIEKSSPDTSIGIDRKNGEKEAFLNLISKSIREIENNNFQKVVISRKKEIKLSEQFDHVVLFDALCDKYDNAFVHLTHIPGIGSWVGATPETLLKIDKDKQFQTVALAATQSFDQETELSETTWSQKDIEEQAMVSRYIINCFKKIRLRDFEEIGPRTCISGNLLHLKTNYRVDMNQVSFPELGSVMLDLLHPTSAVCGMPKEVTQSFIEENEGFDRDYFSGYLGPVNVMDESNIFVNLRCAKLENDRAILFAGAGIISNSIPEKEWIETEIKMDTILSVIEKL